MKYYLTALLCLCAALVIVVTSASAQENIVTNGDFSAPLSTGWNVTAQENNVTIEDGKLTFLPTYTEGDFYGTAPLTFQHGATYRVEFDTPETIGTWRAVLSEPFGQWVYDEVAEDDIWIPERYYEFSGAVASRTVDFEAPAGSGTFTATLRFEPDTLGMQGLEIDNVSITCVSNCASSPTPFAPNAPGNAAFQPTPFYTCGGGFNCGSIPLPGLPILVSPTALMTYTPQPTPPPSGGGTDDGNPGNIGDEQEIIDGLGGMVGDLADDAGNLDGDTVSDGMGGEAGIGGVGSLIDGGDNFLSYVKGLYDKNYFGPFQPIVNLMLIAFPIFIVLTTLQFALPIAGIVVGFIRRTLDLIGNYVPFT